MCRWQLTEKNLLPARAANSWQIVVFPQLQSRRGEAGGASASFHLPGGQIPAEWERRDLPGVSDQQHRLAEAKRPSHQHGQPPHGLGPHHVAELLRDAGNAVDQGTWRAEGWWEEFKL